MELQRYWRIVLAYRRLIISLSFSSLITSVLVMGALPDKYKATALVLVRPERKIEVARQKPGKEILDFPLSQLAPIDAPSKTYIEVIKSRAVVEGIVSALALHEKKRIPSANFFQELVEQFKENVRDYSDGIVHILKYGRIIRVSPFMKAVEDVQENLSVQPTKDTYVFQLSFLGQREEAAAVANTAADVFIQHMLTANAREATGSREFLGRRLHDSEKEVERARLAVREFKEKHGTFSPAEEYSARLEVISDVEKDLEKKRATLSGLRTLYTPDHPRVVGLQIETDQLTQSVARLKSDIASRAEREKELENLKFHVKVSQDKYEALSKEYEDALIQEAQNVSEIRVVSLAAPPTYPSKPIRYYYIGGSFAAVLIFATGLVFFLEFQNARLRSIEDVRATLQLVVLATIPVVKRSSK